MGKNCNISKYLETANITETEKERLFQKELDIWEALRKTKAFKSENGQLFTFKNKYFEGLNAVNKINAEYGANVVRLVKSYPTTTPRFSVAINTLPLVDSNHFLGTQSNLFKDLATTDRTAAFLGETLSLKEAQNYLRKQFPQISEREVVFLTQAALDEVRGEKDRLGTFINGVAYIMQDERGSIYKNVLRHEVFHKIWSEYLTSTERKGVQKALEKELGYPVPSSYAEELLARKFQEFKTTKEESSSWLKSLLNKILRFFGFIQANTTDLNKFFEQVDSGKFAIKKGEELVGEIKDLNLIERTFGSLENYQKSTIIVKDIFTNINNYSTGIARSQSIADSRLAKKQFNYLYNNQLDEFLKEHNVFNLDEYADLHTPVSTSVLLTAFRETLDGISEDEISIAIANFLLSLEKETNKGTLTVASADPEFFVSLILPFSEQKSIISSIVDNRLGRLIKTKKALGREKAALIEEKKTAKDAGISTEEIDTQIKKIDEELAPLYSEIEIYSLINDKNVLKTIIEDIFPTKGTSSFTEDETLSDDDFETNLAMSVIGVDSESRNAEDTPTNYVKTLLSTIYNKDKEEFIDFKKAFPRTLDLLKGIDTTTPKFLEEGGALDIALNNLGTDSDTFAVVSRIKEIYQKAASPYYIDPYLLDKSGKPLKVSSSKNFKFFL